MRRVLDSLPLDDVKDIARTFLAILQFMADHNGLASELDDSNDDVTVS